MKRWLDAAVYFFGWFMVDDSSRFGVVV